MRYLIFLIALVFCVPIAKGQGIYAGAAPSGDSYSVGVLIPAHSSPNSTWLLGADFTHIKKPSIGYSCIMDAPCVRVAPDSMATHTQRSQFGMFSIAAGVSFKINVMDMRMLVLGMAGAGLRQGERVASGGIIAGFSHSSYFVGTRIDTATNPAILVGKNLW